MSLDDYIRPWSGTGFRHIPLDSPFGVLDTRFAGVSEESRWNEAGEPTFYVASDVSIALAEFGRHFKDARPPRAERPALSRATARRQLYRLTISLDLLDLRAAQVLAALSLADAPNCFMSVAYARATARFIRTTTRAQGIIVPSMAALDDLANRWVLALFLERMPDGLDRHVTAAERELVLRLDED